MTRKGTIIIAVLVNACLLIMLFITATTSEEEILLESTTVMHPPSMRQEVALQKPLFDEPVQKSIQEPSKPTSSDKPSSSSEKTVIVQTSENVTHKLPKIEGAKPEKVVVAQPKPAVEKKPVVASAPSTVPAPSSKKITIKKGDTLEKIAKRHGSTVKKIVAFNHLPSTFLRIGQVLNIPNGSKQAAAKPAETTQGAYYVVKSGDNPWTIAMKHHMKVNDLLKLNHLDEKKAKRLKPGDRLRIR